MNDELAQELDIFIHKSEEEVLEHLVVVYRIGLKLSQ